MNPTESKSPVVDKLTPVGFRVLLNIYKKPTTTVSGYEIPEAENGGMPILGQIVALGVKTRWERLLVTFGFKKRYVVGQWIYFRRYAVDELKFTTPEGDMNLFVLEESEIIGIAAMQ